MNSTFSAALSQSLTNGEVSKSVVDHYVALFVSIMESDPGKKSKRLSSYQEYWDIVIGQYDRKCLQANKLPRNRQIMQRYPTLQLESGSPNKAEIRRLANIIADELMGIWGKACLDKRQEGLC